MGRALQRRREARWGKEKGAARRKRTTRGGKHPGGVPSDPSYTVNAGRRVTRIPGSTHADRSRDFALENIGEKMVLSSGGRNIRDWITHAAAGKPDDPISMPAETTSVHRTLLITRIILAQSSRIAWKFRIEQFRVKFSDIPTNRSPLFQREFFRTLCRTDHWKKKKRGKDELEGWTKVYYQFDLNSIRAPNLLQKTHLSVSEFVTEGRNKQTEAD